MRPPHSSSVSASKMSIILALSVWSRSIISPCGVPRKAWAPASTCLSIPRTPSGSGAGPVPRAASKLAKQPSVVSTRWPTMSRTCQCPAPVGASHTPGSAASATMAPASSRTARSTLPLDALSMKFHSLMWTPVRRPVEGNRRPPVAYARVGVARKGSRAKPLSVLSAFGTGGVLEPEGRAHAPGGGRPAEVVADPQHLLGGPQQRIVVERRVDGGTGRRRRADDDVGDDPRLVPHDEHRRAAGPIRPAGEDPAQPGREPHVAPLHRAVVGVVAEVRGHEAEGGQRPVVEARSERAGRRRAEREVVPPAGGPVVAAVVVGGGVVLDGVDAGPGGEDAGAGHVLHVAAGLAVERPHLAEQVVGTEAVVGGRAVVAHAERPARGGGQVVWQAGLGH